MLELSNVSKRFYGNQALKDVTFSAYPGEIHALMGQNGAGKSTLMKILAGVYSLDAGEIRIGNELVRISSPKDAELNGISIVHQEMSTLPHLTVAQNIMIGQEPTNKWGGIDRKNLNEMAVKSLNRLGITINPDTKISDLSVSQQQACEIAKAISKNPKIIILDEPTAALTKLERDALFATMRKMKDEQFTIIFISHHLEEVFELADHCTVLRDGQVVFTGSIEEVDEYKLVQMMVGYSVENFFPPRTASATNRVALELQQFGGGRVEPIDLKLKYGEIVGLSGLLGSGCAEVARMIFGVDKVSNGRILVDGQEVDIKNPNQALKSGISLISEDRRTEGLALNLSIRSNMSLTSMILGKNEICRNQIIQKENELEFSERLAKRLKIKCSSVEDRVISLSGGNQQKISIAKWIETGCNIFIFVEPTKGIDVAAKVEVYRLINELADKGAAILMISSYNPELLGMCDRIIAMSRGRITKEFGPNSTETELVMAQSM